QMLYMHPANLFVATFIGSPAMNLATAKLVSDDGGPAVTFASYKIPMPARAVSERPGLDRFLGREVIVGIRPSAFEDAAFAQDTTRPRITAEVTVTEELGSEANLLFRVHAPPVHHDVMVAKFDRAAKDEVEAEELAGAGESLW